MPNEINSDTKRQKSDIIFIQNQGSTKCKKPNLNNQVKLTKGQSALQSHIQLPITTNNVKMVKLKSQFPIK